MGKTSWQSKERYNRTAYGTILVKLPKALVEDFKAKCRAEGVSQASVIRDAVEKYLKK